MVRYRDQQMTGFSLIMPLHQDCRIKTSFLAGFDLGPVHIFVLTLIKLIKERSQGT